MSLRHWDPFAELMSVRRLMDDLVADGGLPPARQIPAGKGQTAFPVDVFETQDAYVVTAALPGATSDDVSVSLAGNRLSLRADVKPLAQPSGRTHTYRERRAGRFARDLSLPTAVIADAVEATVKDGRLTVTIPKDRDAKPRSIAINP
ncbi:MAG: Hsp20/alpha crystallin family protein [Chloroflexota bacterium]